MKGENHEQRDHDFARSERLRLRIRLSLRLGLQLRLINRNLKGMNGPPAGQRPAGLIFFEMLSIDGKAPAFRSREDRLPPRTTVRIAWMPEDRPGSWMDHCHSRAPDDP